MSTSALPRPSALPSMSRNTTIVISVIALHVAVLWAMQTGLLRRVAEAVVPAEILVEIMAPPAPPAPKPKPQPQPKVQVKAPTPKPVAPTPTPPVAQPAPTPLAIAPSATAPAPSAAAPTAVAGATTSANSGSTSNAPVAPPAPPKVEMPSSDAAYLNNPKPQYPALSKRLHEQGKVVVRALIGTDGQASQASVKTSSGFERLDQAAVNTVLKWRYVPGKRGGVPEAMWFDVPVNWVLQ
ncbi:energy transducer TonB [Rhodoferax sp.]|uniref:energy transducer TonB n=1 Tax=Rhodoferax sp. TaxID=50421 RepID=UPI002ACE3FCE|nr:energy transducer TonB [Rhodoferax sp.]MDZ7918581.1 energy transducer TonB [Rhodoferax sp.]